jgi:hypothetical protein
MEVRLILQWKGKEFLCIIKDMETLVANQEDYICKSILFLKRALKDLPTQGL